MNLKHRIRMTLGHSPVTLPLFPLISSNIREKQLAVGTATQACIEGFPRSANSFFTWYFRQSNPTLLVAHHLHIPANILAATKRHLPSVVLIRSPADAVLSAMVGFAGRLSIDLLFEDYLHFYNRLMPVFGDCVISDFTTSTNEPAKVIEALNARFGTAFNTHLPDGVDVDDFADHARKVEARITGAEDDIKLLTTPDARKEELKDGYRAAVKHHGRLSEAVELYHACLSHPNAVR